MRKRSASRHSRIARILPSTAHPEHEATKQSSPPHPPNQRLSRSNKVANHANLTHTLSPSPHRNISSRQNPHHAHSHSPPTAGERHRIVSLKRERVCRCGMNNRQRQPAIPPPHVTQPCSPSAHKVPQRPTTAPTPARQPSVLQLGLPKTDRPETQIDGGTARPAWMRGVLFLAAAETLCASIWPRRISSRSRCVLLQRRRALFLASADVRWPRRIGRHSPCTLR
eukprot:scaffold12408_cov112-Isochrysis_galbana.AAC.3